MPKKTGTILSNFDLINLANRMNLPLVGVHSKDRLPKQKNEGHFILEILKEVVPIGHVLVQFLKMCTTTIHTEVYHLLKWINILRLSQRKSNIPSIRFKHKV